MPSIALFLVASCFFFGVDSFDTCAGISSPPCRPHTRSRRGFVSQLGKAAATFAPLPILRGKAAVAAPPPTMSWEDEVKILNDGSNALGSLLDNWERATVDCNYADVPRELLEQKNKEELLEKASTFALFDKSTAVVSCRKTNRIVRDYIGATGKGPLVGAEKRMLKRIVADRVDPDSLDSYFAEVENFSQAITKATTLSYTAGMADLDSVNNFAKGDEKASSGDSSNLEQAKKAITDARVAMDKVIAFLTIGQE